MANYWIVGAMFGGGNDQAPIFIRRGYWRLGWQDVDQPAMTRRRNQIEQEDRIAIKRMMGRGSPNIRITTLGIVKEVDLEDGRVYVNWVVEGLNRIVDGRGCFGTIHGPFAEDDDWVRKIFHL